MRTAFVLLWGITKGLLGVALIALVVLGAFYLPALLWIAMMILLVLVAIFVRLGTMARRY